MPSAALAGSASSNTTTGPCRPVPGCTRLRLAAAAARPPCPPHAAGDRDHSRHRVLDQRPAGVTVAEDHVDTPAGRKSHRSATAAVLAGVVSTACAPLVLPRPGPAPTSHRHHHRVVPRGHRGRRRRSARADERGEPGHVLAGGDRPSSIRAAPAKNRIWSTIGGFPRPSVSATGLPVFRDSAATNSSARDSDRVGDPQQGQAALGRRGVPPAGRASAAEVTAASTSALRTPGPCRTPRRWPG